MKHRKIVVTIDFDMREFHDNQITPNQKVKEIVEKEMIEKFGWDEGYLGVKVEVNDKT